MTLDELEAWARATRASLELAWSDETCAPGSDRATPSAGQCAATAVVVRDLIGGMFYSAKVNGISHWWNRVLTDTHGWCDVDLTADQFGLQPVIVSPFDAHTGATHRRESELTGETLARARLLAKSCMGLVSTFHSSSTKSSQPGLATGKG